MPEISPIATLGWLARARAIASKGLPGDAEAWLTANRAPLGILKSPLGAGSTTDSDLGDSAVSIGAWSDAMRTRSAFYRILSDGGFTRVPLRTRCAITVTPASGAIVNEGWAVPLGKVRLGNISLEPVKAAALIVVTNELLANVGAAGQQLFNSALAGAVSDVVDGAFLSMVAGTGTTSPSSGTSAVDAKADLRAALLSVNTFGAARLFWICAGDVAKMASTLAAAGGLDAFPAMSASGGEMAALPCIVSSGLPKGTLMLIDGSGIAADGGPVDVRASKQADILMDTAPGMSSTVPTPAAVVSTFQTDSTAVLTTVWFGAQLLRDDCVAVIENIDWGASP
jgi:hypothetical protein